MNNIVRSIYGNYLQSCANLGLTFEIPDNTTLNEKLNIQAGVHPNVTDYPTISYLAIGNGGHKFITGAGGLAIPESVQHISTDAALFNQLPFVLRVPELDLSPAQRANYALRRQETHNGKTYYAYYLKRINKDNVKAKMEYRVINNGVTVVSPFVPDTAVLNPTPVDLSSVDVNTVTGKYVAATAKMTISLSADDVTELLHVAEVLYSNEAFAIISELAICSGKDKIVNVSGVSGNFNFTEAIGVQVSSHCSVFAALSFNKDGWDATLDIGASEPLYAISN